MEEQNFGGPSRRCLCAMLVVFGLAVGAGIRGFAETPPVPCASTASGDIEILPLKSTVFENERNLRIWLPPGYHDAANASKTYPVLYLFDGQMLFDRCTAPGQIAEWRVDETLADLIGRGVIPPIIVVGIDNAGAQRNHEYQPYPNPLLFSNDPQGLAGDRIPSFLAEDVLPFVSSHYRISKDRKETGIGGSSAGAVAALIALMRRPDLFGLGLLESTSLQFGNGQLIRETSPILRGPLRVSIGVGTAELGPDISNALDVPAFNASIVQLSQTLAGNFKAAMFNHPDVKFTVQEGARHGAEFWGQRFPAAVKFLFSAPAQ
jgi:predicted alpha/beta superfamily hydrolase